MSVASKNFEPTAGLTTTSAAFDRQTAAARNPWSFKRASWQFALTHRVWLLALGLLAFGVLRHIPHSKGMSGVFLKRSTSRETGYLSAPDLSGMIGASGTALTDLRPSGTAGFGSDRLDVVTEGPFIAQGTRVIVVRDGVSGLVVRELPAESESAPRES